MRRAWIGLGVSAMLGGSCQADPSSTVMESARDAAVGAVDDAGPPGVDASHDAAPVTSGSADAGASSRGAGRVGAAMAAGGAAGADVASAGAAAQPRAAGESGSAAVMAATGGSGLGGGSAQSDDPCGVVADGAVAVGVQRERLISPLELHSAYDGVHVYQVVPSLPLAAADVDPSFADAIEPSTVTWAFDDAYVADLEHRMA